MKRRLRPSIELALIIVSIIELMFIVSIDDFELSFIPVLLLVMASFVFNVCILRKYGRGKYGA